MQREDQKTMDTCPKCMLKKVMEKDILKSKVKLKEARRHTSVRSTSFKVYLKVSTEIEKEVCVKICEDLWPFKQVTLC